MKKLPENLTKEFIQSILDNNERDFDRLLKQEPALANARSAEGVPALAMTTLPDQDRIKFTERLLFQGAEVNATFNFFSATEHYYNLHPDSKETAYYREKKTQAIQSYGSEENLKRTPLDSAVIFKNSEVEKLLRRHGAMTFHESSDLVSSLVSFITTPDIQPKDVVAVNNILKVEPKLAKDYVDGYPMIFHAIRAEHFHYVRRLWIAGADLQAEPHWEIVKEKAKEISESELERVHALSQLPRFRAQELAHSLNLTIIAKYLDVHELDKPALFTPIWKNKRPRRPSLDKSKLERIGTGTTENHRLLPARKQKAAAAATADQSNRTGFDD